MNKHIVSIIGAAVLSIGSVCYAEKAVPAKDLTPALGKVKHAGQGKYDFKRSKHDLRLEDIVMNATPNGDGSIIEGSFTMTHLYLGIGGIHLRPADHILGSFIAKDGKTDVKVTPAKGKNPWGYAVAAGATAVGADPKTAEATAKIVTGLSGQLSGDAAPFMSQAIVNLTDRLGNLSKKKYE